MGTLAYGCSKCSHTYDTAKSGPLVLDFGRQVEAHQRAGCSGSVRLVREVVAHSRLTHSPTAA